MARLRWICIFTLLVAGVGSSVLMVSRYRADELWGHLPLIQFLTSWLLLVFILYRKENPLEDRFFLITSLGGIALALGFPPTPFPFLLAIGFVPLLWVIHGEEQKRKRLFFYAFNTFIVWNILATFWVANTAYAAGIFANVVNSFLMTLPILLYAYVSRKLGLGIGLLAFVACWLTFEFLHMRWELYWPWLTLGNGLANMHWGVQWYQYTGTLGGSAWVLTINYLIWQVIAHAEAQRKNTIMLLFVLAAPILLSLSLYFSYTEVGNSINVVVVQPNLEPHYEEDQYSTVQVIDRFIELSRQAVDEETDYLVFPETSFNRVNLDQIEQHPIHQPFEELLRDFPQLKLITGLGAYRYLSDPEEQQLSTSRRGQLRDGTDFYVEFYNCAVQLASDAERQEYYKALYVPGAEYFPLKNILPFMKPLVDKLGGSIEGYRVREKFNLFSSGEAVVTPAICYESIFGEFLGNFVRKGSNVIFIMTNDGWWDNTAGHRQHAAFAKLRAVEFRRAIARSANMGTCGYINQRGDYSQKSAYAEMGALSGTIRLNDRITFYARWGDFAGRISLFFTILLAGRAAVDRYRKN